MLKDQPIHVCVITTAHPIDDVRVNNKFAQACCESGFRVSWIGPGHAFFDRSKDNRDNIKFILASPNRCRLDRLLSPTRVRKLAATVNDVNIYYAPDPDSIPVAIYLAKRNGAKVIFDIHEVYHGALLDRWLMGWRANFIRNYIKWRIAHFCSKCDLVIGVSDAVLAPYVSDGVKFMIIRSCAPVWFAKGSPADVCGAQRSTFNVMHGKSDLGRGTMKVVEAAAISRDHVRDLRFIMFKPVNSINNNGADPLSSKIQELNLSEVIDIRPSVSMQEMPEILQTCDAGLIAYGRDLGVDSLPNRLFEYMAAGLAIIAPVYAREIAKIVDAEKCGILVDYEDPEDIAKAITHLRNNPDLCRDMGRRAREAFMKRHNWDVEVRPLIDRMRSWFPTT